MYISNCTYKHNIRYNFWLHLMVCWVLERSNVLSKQVQGNDYDELAFLAQFGLVLRLSRPRERPGGNRQEVENERHIDCCSNIGNDCTSIILSWGNGSKHDPLATICGGNLNIDETEVTYVQNWSCFSNNSQTVRSQNLHVLDIFR